MSFSSSFSVRDKVFLMPHRVSALPWTKGAEMTRGEIRRFVDAGRIATLTRNLQDTNMRVMRLCASKAVPRASRPSHPGRNAALQAQIPATADAERVRKERQST